MPGEPELDNSNEEDTSPPAKEKKTIHHVDSEDTGKATIDNLVILEPEQSQNGQKDTSRRTTDICHGGSAGVQ